ncbi:MAG: hypothetical protein WD069_00920 [Planctomycetales bacterium]
MIARTKNELESFHEFVGERLRQGDAVISPEQALAQWRERVETVEAIREGLDDVRAGRVRPAAEVIDSLREACRAETER